MFNFDKKRVYSLRKTSLGLISLAVGLLLFSPKQVAAFSDIVDVSNEAEFIEAFQMKEDTTLNREVVAEPDTHVEIGVTDEMAEEADESVETVSEDAQVSESSMVGDEAQNNSEKSNPQGIDFTTKEYSEQKSEEIQAPEQKKQFENYRTI